MKPCTLSCSRCTYLVILLCLVDSQHLYLVENGQHIRDHCVNSSDNSCYTIRPKTGVGVSASHLGASARKLLERCKFVQLEDGDSSSLVGVCSYAAVYLQGAMDISADTDDWKFHLSYQMPIEVFPDNVWRCDDGSTIPSHTVCDAGRNGLLAGTNCPDLSDEKGCQYSDCSGPAPHWWLCRFVLGCFGPCSDCNSHAYCDMIPHNYQCPGGPVRHNTERCTRSWNCPGGEDEIYCQNCDKNYNQLYHPEWINNGWTECGDGTDEPGWNNSWTETLKSSFGTLIAFGALPSKPKNLERVTSVTVHQDGPDYDLAGSPSIQKIVLVHESKPQLYKTCVPDDGLPLSLAAGKSVQRLDCS